MKNKTKKHWSQGGNYLKILFGKNPEVLHPQDRGYSKGRKDNKN